MDTQQFVQQEAARAAEELGVPNESNEAPVEAPSSPESTETPTEVPPAPPAEPVQEQSPETPIVPAPAEPAESEEDDGIDIPTFQYAQQGVRQVEQQVQQPQISQAPVAPVPALNLQDLTDQYGNVDMAKFGQAMTQRDQVLAQMITQQVVQSVLPQAAQISTAQVMAAKQEERLWESAFKKYPQLKDNKELRDVVHKTRMGSIQTGGNDSPLKTAERIFKYIGAAKSEGAQQATQSVRRQASAHLETSDNTASERGLKQKQNYENISHRDRRVANTARTDLIKDWLKEGKI